MRNSLHSPRRNCVNSKPQPRNLLENIMAKKPLPFVGKVVPAKSVPVSAMPKAFAKADAKADAKMDAKQDMSALSKMMRSKMK